MSFFVYRLIPPRPSFSTDLTDEEQLIMMRHGEYWKQHSADRTALVFGPVADPKGVWGLGVIETEDAEAATKLADADPAITTGLCTYEVLPMLSAVLRSDVSATMG